jgi:16S rRNA G1207 methylase RsmC
MIKKLFLYLFYEHLKVKNYPNFGYPNIFFLKIFGYFYFFFEFFFPIKKSLLPIDIIITIAPKDIDKLENCLIGIKKNILHPIKKIFIVGKKNFKLKSVEKLFSCIHIEESDLLNKKKLNIRYKYNNIDRSGWLYQQLLNYQAVILLGKERYKLAINSDTVFSKKQKFEKIKK